MARHHLLRILTVTAVLLGIDSLPKDVFAQASKSSGTKIGVIGSGNIGSTMTTAFAMVNNVPTRYIPAKSTGPQSVRGRNIPFLDNNTITIYTGKARNLRHYVERLFAIARRRRHSVRGFWRNVEYGKAKVACEHVPIERDGAYALCGKCEALIRWIDHHERGDATLGYVDHSYEVTK